MCGIVGIVGVPRPDATETIARMSGTLRHRGPDHSGSASFPKCALGAARLAIIDPGSGNQPLLSADRKTAVVCNGEIYGYRDIRSQLEGFPFRTRGDTEVLLALYAKHGVDLLPYVPGMFAFAIWDEATEVLVCGRDRFGEKPFYYAIGEDGCFLFASEIKAILATGRVRPEIDRVSLAYYLQHLYVPPGRTIYSNIHVLPPAHRLVLEGGRVRMDRYWDLPRPRRMAFNDAAEELRRLLDRAVAKQMDADVPVGAFLSGGLDSSTIVALAARRRDRLPTFSFRFEAGIEDEAPYAREVSTRWSTEHTVVSDAGVAIAELMLKMPDVYDEPFADSSALPTYLLAGAARNHVTVILGGDGADELLGGYFYWTRGLQDVDPAWRRALSGGRAWTELWSRLFRAAQPGLARTYLSWRASFKPPDLHRLGFSEDPGATLPMSRYAGGSMNDVMRLDLETYLPGDILVKTDRASMAHGLELRSPFLDPGVAELCLSLPSTFKVSETSEKLLLRQACQDLWPPPIRTRTKQGFGGPIPVWLRRPDVRELEQEFLRRPGAPLYQILPFDAVQPYLADDDQRKWTLLTLAVWLDRRRTAA